MRYWTERACFSWIYRQLLLDKIRAGTTLIVDRYVFSGAVFTAAKQLPGLDLEWCKVVLIPFALLRDQGLIALAKGSVAVYLIYYVQSGLGSDIS